MQYVKLRMKHILLIKYTGNTKLVVALILSPVDRAGWLTSCEYPVVGTPTFFSLVFFFFYLFIYLFYCPI